MKIFKQFPLPEQIVNPVITLGTFDGVHSGHVKILQRLKQKAEAIRGTSVVITFDPHPRQVLFPHDDNLRLLNTLEERIENIGKHGIDIVIVQEFTKEFSRLTAIEFVRDYLINQIGLKELVIGHDHHFGRNREGSIEILKEMAQTFGFDLDQIPAQLIDEVSVSSTKVRNAIQTGEMQTANQFLGYNFCLSGLVVKGKGLGNQLGFPTANINIANPHKILPAFGVYAVRTFIDNTWYKGVMNVGIKPTVSTTADINVEVYIMDFSQDIYGKQIKVEVLKRIRSEKKFDSVNELKKQIGLDVEEAKKLFS